MFGLYLNTASKLDYELDQVVDAIGIDRPQAAVGHAFDTIPSGPPQVNGETGSVLDRPLRASWASAAITRSFRLVGLEWAKSVLCSALLATEDSGSVWLRPPAGDSTALMTIEAIEAWLGQPVERLSSGWVRIDGGLEPQSPASLLWWYLENDGHLILQEARMRARASGSDDYLSSIVSGTSRRPISSPNWSAANISTISHSHRYWFTGIGYKAGMLSHIIRQRHGGQSLSMVDIGSGPGWVPMEMLLAPDADVTSAVALDRRLDYGALGVSVAGQVGIQPGRFTFSDIGASAYDWTGTDVVTALGSLLYLPRADTREVLGRAWESLRPGGLLIVHENIQQESFRGRSNDYDIMFTVEELDSLLERFGSIERYASNTPSVVGAGDAGNKALFRVVQKQ
ncbi:class I SAM-dependent methyltransferase [Euzebya pacifica]|uniref:class I SAM-dependent methyltransferase n=1 Tax=Euzebya pacifica TaxID=1608957 RepID=UPI000DF824B7|nr:class I SAM-dependent methyltransferase [Euzebya pacifica]